MLGGGSGVWSDARLTSVKWPLGAAVNRSKRSPPLQSSNTTTSHPSSVETPPDRLPWPNLRVGCGCGLGWDGGVACRNDSITLTTNGWSSQSSWHFNSASADVVFRSCFTAYSFPLSLWVHFMTAFPCPSPSFPANVYTSRNPASTRGPGRVCTRAAVV